MKVLVRIKIPVNKTTTMARRRNSTRKKSNATIVKSEVILQLNADPRKYQEKRLMKQNLSMTMKVMILKDQC
jgi:hypothetical protein